MQVIAFSTIYESAVSEASRDGSFYRVCRVASFSCSRKRSLRQISPSTLSFQ